MQKLNKLQEKNERFNLYRKVNELMRKTKKGLINTFKNYT